MDTKKIIKGKYILIVDDEQDVLDLLVELLSFCIIDAALTYEQGLSLLKNNSYDVAILDIMGVNGFKLLEVAVEQEIPALMLTAHALSEKNLKRSMKEGASYYAPKEEMDKIELFLADIIEAKNKNKNVLVRWFERLSGFYDTRFSGTDWRVKEKEFWEKKLKEIPKI
jgi:DNA-binding NtrC family response regulator